MHRTCIIANPAAGRGKGAKVLPYAREALARYGITDVRITAAAGDERRLASYAALAGIETVVALGGDGTWGNVARGILDSGRDTRLTLLAAGTGNDFALGLGLPAGDLDAMVRIAVESGEKRVDVGRVDDAHFLNVAGFGIEAEVLKATRSGRLQRGPVVYVAAAIPKLFSYKPLVATVSPDGAPVSPSGKYLAIIASNGPRFGGGFRIAPGASSSDGLLDLIMVRDASLTRRTALLLHARLGSHVEEPEVEQHKVRGASLQFEEAPLLDVDGELLTARSTLVRISCVAGALRVAVQRT